MANKIIIKNPSAFITFLSSVASISPGAEFIFSPEGCNAHVNNPSQTLKASFYTDAGYAEDMTSICTNEIKRLKLSVEMVANFIDKATNPVIEFNIETNPSPRITYNKKAKIELNLTNKDRMIQYIAVPAKKYGEDFICLIPKEGFKMLSKIQSIISDKAKIHLYERPGQDGIFAELDDKSDAGSSKAGIPLTLSVEHGAGQFGAPLIFEFSDVALWNPFGVANVALSRISSAGKPIRAIQIKSEVEIEKSTITCEITMASIKAGI